MQLRKMIPIVSLAAALVLSGCSNTTTKTTEKIEKHDVKITNCGVEKTYKAPIKKLFTNDGNILSIALSAGAEKEIIAISGMNRDKDILGLKYGKVVSELKQVSEKYPNLENILGAAPEMVFAGWGYGFSKDKITPEILKEKNIESYILTESCRKEDGTRGLVDPWKALSTDIENIGKLTGHEDKAKEAIANINGRLEKIKNAPKGPKEPVIFLFDSGKENIFSSGSYGAPEAIIKAAGAKNALSDVKDTWTSVSWERLTKANPDVIVFVDYPPQSYQEKIDILKSNPASKDLEAVKQGRFVNLPYAMWTSGPLNIDAAEYLRLALEKFGYHPASGITPAVNLQKLQNLPGNEWLKGKK